MSHISGQDSVPPSDYQGDECMTQSFKQGKQFPNHVDDERTAPSLCTVPASSTFYKTQTDHPDGLSVKIDLGLLTASTDDDSGLPDLFYKSSSSLKNSTSCSDSTYGDSEEDRPGSFDYMPSQSHVRIVHSFNPPYDEEVRVDSGTDGSSVESPRSETSVTHDEYNLAEEGTEMTTISYKETPRPYSRERKHSDDCWDYILGGKQQSDDCMEDDYRDDMQSLLNTSSYSSSCQREASSQIDKGISYGLQKLDEFRSGHQTQLKLFTPNNQYRDQQYKSLEGKNKLNSIYQDDSDKPELSGLVDINGNPKPLDTANNSQMHQLPRGKSENTAASGSQSSFTSASISQSYSSSSADSNTLDRKKERKRMKQQRQKWTSAGAYEDHKNFTDIKEILDFVEGPHSGSKSEGKSTKRKQERSRRKDHSLNGPLALEDTAGGDDGLDSMETVVVALQPGLEAMGNSSGKSLGENNISRAESTEDSLDKNSEFHDCLNTLPTELINQEKFETIQQSGKSSTATKSISAEVDKNDFCFKGHNNIEKISTDNEKIVNKKSTKVKNKKDKQELIKDNGPLSPSAVNVKSTESTNMKDSLLLKSVTPKDNRNFHYSSDTELPSEVKREDSFTEVKKRKKRLVGKDFIKSSSNHATSLNNHSHSINGYPHNNSRPRPFTPPLLPATTVVSVSYLPVSSQTCLTRDLSPSAFPLLPGHGSLAANTDNRRNSCGDISTESVDNKIYDSDRESAKSLPDARGTRVCGDMSPVYPLSYARIAAAPCKADNTNSPSSESGVTSGSHNSSISSSVTHTPGSSIDIVSPQSPSKASIVPERKTTVWKGSPRERRHSIGSSPEDMEDKEKTSVTQRNRQCGSQEVLSRDAVNSTKISSNVTVSSPPVKIVDSVSSNILELDSDLQEKTQQPVRKLVLNNPQSVVTSETIGIRSPVYNNLKPNNFEYAPSNSISCQTNGNTITVPNKLTAISDSVNMKEKLRIALNTSSNAAIDLTKSNKHLPSQDITASNVATINSENDNLKTVISKKKIVPTSRPAQKPNSGSNNTKSVIFLDKRFGATSPQNLGITFGFDLSYECTSEPTSQSTSHIQQPVPVSLPQLVTVASAPSSLSSSSPVLTPLNPLPQTSHCPPTHHHIPSAAKSAIASSNQPLISSSQSSDYNNILPKVPHKQGLCNGLILPSSTSGQNDILKESSTSNNNSVCNDNNSTNLQLSNRTSPSTLNPDDHATQNISSQRISAPSIMSNLTSSSSILANSSLGQSNKSTHCITDVIIPQSNPIGFTFSPNHPPPPFPHGVPAIVGERTVPAIVSDKTFLNNATDKVNFKSSTATPLIHEKPEQNPEDMSYPGETETVHCASSISAPSAKAGEATEIVDISLVTKEVSESQPPKNEAALQKQQQCLSVPTEVFHVVYGEKIKPVIGCGKLMFKNYIISQSNKGNAADLASFLKKKWLEDVSLKKGSSAFVTLSEE